jgi:uncharacterized protein
MTNGSEYDYATIRDRCWDVVNSTMASNDPSHDVAHVKRVANMAVVIANTDFVAKGKSVDVEVVELAAILHDVEDDKVGCFVNEQIISMNPC